MNPLSLIGALGAEGVKWLAILLMAVVGLIALGVVGLTASIGWVFGIALVVVGLAAFLGLGGRPVPYRVALAIAAAGIVLAMAPIPAMQISDTPLASLASSQGTESGPDADVQLSVTHSWWRDYLNEYGLSSLAWSSLSLTGSSGGDVVVGPGDTVSVSVDTRVPRDAMRDHVYLMEGAPVKEDFDGRDGNIWVAGDVVMASVYDKPENRRQLKNKYDVASTFTDKYSFFVKTTAWQARELDSTSYTVDIHNDYRIDSVSAPTRTVTLSLTAPTTAGAYDYSVVEWPRSITSGEQWYPAIGHKSFTVTVATPTPTPTPTPTATAPATATSTPNSDDAADTGTSTGDTRTITVTNNPLTTLWNGVVDFLINLGGG